MSHGNVKDVTQTDAKVIKKPHITDPATGEEFPTYDPWGRTSSSRMYSEGRLHQDRLKDLSTRRRKLIDLDPTTTEAGLLTMAGAWEAAELQKQFNDVRESVHLSLQRKAQAKQLKAEREDTDKRIDRVYDKDVVNRVMRDHGAKYPWQVSEDKYEKQQIDFDADKTFKENKKRIDAELKEEETLRVKQEEGESKTHREILDALIEKHGVEKLFAGVDKGAWADKYHNYRGGLEETIERIAHSEAGIASKDIDLKKILGELKGAGYGITGQLSSIVNFSKIGDDIDNLKKKLQGKELTGEDRRKTKNIVNLLERTRDALEISIDKTLKKGVIVRRKDRFKSFDPIAELEEELRIRSKGVEDKLQSGTFLDELEGMRSKPIEGLDWLGYPELQTKLDFDDRDAFIKAQAQKLGGLTADRVKELDVLSKEMGTKQAPVVINPATKQPMGGDTGITTDLNELGEMLDDSILNTGDGGVSTVGEATGGAYQEIGINNPSMKQAVFESQTFSGFPNDVSHFELATILKLESGGTNNSPNTIGDKGNSFGAYQSQIPTVLSTQHAQGKSEEQIRKELKDPTHSTIYAGQILSSIKADLSSSPHYKNLSPREQSALALFAYNAGITRTKTLLQITKAKRLRDVLDFKGNIIIQGKKRQGVPSISKRYGQRAFKHLKNLDEVNRVKKKAKKLSGKFDPEGSGYDEQTAAELNRLRPLTMPKPTRKGSRDRETVSNEGAFSAWVWHEEDGRWVKHGGSVDPRTGMLLKGRGYHTSHLEDQASKELGNVISKKDDGRYYSLSPEGNVYGSDEHRLEVKSKAIQPVGIHESPTRESLRQDIQPRSPQEIDTEVPERVPIESGDDEVQRITLAQEQRRFKDAYDARMEVANRTIEKFLAAGASPAQIEMAKLHLIDMRNASEWMDRHPTAPKFQEAFQSFIKAMKEIVIYKEQ